MKRNTVLAGQSFLDKVVELTGNIENAFEMSLLNNVEINRSVPVGSVVASTIKKRKAVVALFNDLNSPATEIKREQNEYYLPGEFPYSF